MKNFIKILIFSFFAITSYAQQATEIDSKSVKLPKYADQDAIELAIPIPQRQQGMLVYNIGTASNWYYNGTAWTNTASSGSLTLPYSQTQTNTSTLFQLTNFGSGGVAGFRIYNPLNSSNAIYASTDGTGAALRADASGNGTSIVSIAYDDANAIRVSSANGTGLLSTSFGNGTAGSFRNQSLTSYYPTMLVINDGLGNAGNFDLYNPLNASSSISATTLGTGVAAYFQGTKALETSGAIKFGSPGVGTPYAGQVLTATDNLGNATWQAIPSISAPLVLTLNTSTPSINAFNSYVTGTNGKAGVFEITNASNNNLALSTSTNGGGDSFYSYTNGLGRAGLFHIDNPTNFNTALSSITNGDGIAISGTTTGNSVAGFFSINNTLNNNFALTGQTNGAGHAIYGVTTGTGLAGYFQIANGSNTSNSLVSTTNGTGKAGSFSIFNPLNSNNAIYATTAGTGKAAYFHGTNALETDGTIKFGGSGVGTIAAGKVLTSTDNLGNATWQTPQLSLPYTQTSGSDMTMFKMINSRLAPTIGQRATAIYGEYNGTITADIGLNTGYGSGVVGVFNGTGGVVKNVNSGVFGLSLNKASGVYGLSDGYSVSIGVKGESDLGYGIYGSSSNSIGGFFTSFAGYALITGTGNVGIGTPTPTAKLEVVGYTKLGDDATAPKIKMKELAVFNSAATYNGQSPQAHGLTASKIISVSVLLEWTTGYFVPVEYSSDVNLRYNYFISPTEIIVQNNTPGPTCPYICGKPVKVLITYKE